MNKQKTFTRILVAMTIMSIMIMAFDNTTIQVNATTMTTVDVSASRICDIALSNTGVIADRSTIEGYINDVVNTIEGTARSYHQWCEENGKVKNATTFEEYLESDAYSTLPTRLAGWILRSADILNYIITGESLTDELRDMLPSAMTGLPAAEIARGFTLSSDVVEEIRNDFDRYLANYGDYFYVQTIGPQQLNPLWFSQYDYYEKVKGIIESLPYLGYMYRANGYPNTGYYEWDANNTISVDDIRITVYDNEVNFVAEPQEGYMYYVKNTYSNTWQTPAMAYDRGGGLRSFPTSYEEILNDSYTISNAVEYHPRMSELGYHENEVIHFGLLSNDGRMVRMFNSEAVMRQFTLGQSSYYYSSDSMEYQRNTDNSVRVTGDYLIDNSNVYSHDIIQETIDNSENINEETINNIVNDSSQTIINNYGYTNPDGGSSGGGSGNGNNSILDGLGSIISGISDIIGFLLSVIGSVLSLIGDLFETIFEGLRTIGSLFSGFSGLMGEIFGFIPEELINFLVLAVEASIGIAIWRKFSK